MNMKRGFRYKLAIAIILPVVWVSCSTNGAKELFDGKTFSGWEGDTLNTWSIIDGTIVGGSLTDTVPHNDFLVTTQEFGDFILELKFKLEGNEGLINAGVQFRSQRLENPAYEMIGYQADMGDNYWGALYDESRRKKVLAAPDSTVINSIVKIGDWNDYKIQAEGNRIQLFLNGKQTVDYTESGQNIPQNGFIGLQIHGAGKAKVSYKDILIRPIN